MEQQPSVATDTEEFFDVIKVLPCCCFSLRRLLGKKLDDERAHVQQLLQQIAALKAELAGSRQQVAAMQQGIYPHFIYEVCVRSGLS